MVDESDTQLLDAWAAGDEASGRALYRRHCDRLTDFVARRTDHDVADLVQRAFVRCLAARRDAGTRVDNPRAYLYRIVRNELYDRFTSTTAHAAVDPAVTSLADLGTGPATNALRNEEQARLLRALRQIPLDDQVALELSYWEGLSMLELAEVLEVGRSAAISRVHRARGRLREALMAQGASVSTAQSTVTSLEAWQRSLRSNGASSVYAEEPGEDPADRGEI